MPIHGLDASGSSLRRHIWGGAGRPMPVVGHKHDVDPSPGHLTVPFQGARTLPTQAFQELSNAMGKNSEVTSKPQRNTGGKLRSKALKGSFRLLVGRRRHLTAGEGEGAGSEGRRGRSQQPSPCETSCPGAAPCSVGERSGFAPFGHHHQLEGARFSQPQTLPFPEFSRGGARAQQQCSGCAGVSPGLRNASVPPKRSALLLGRETRHGACPAVLSSAERLKNKPKQQQTTTSQNKTTKNQQHTINMGNSSENISIRSLI